MDVVYVVSLNGAEGALARDLDAALARAAALIRPGEAADPERDFPPSEALSRAGHGGSAFHRVRHEALCSGHEGLAIVAHRLDAPPTHASEIGRYDLMHELDPAFSVQSTLYAADESDETLDALADALEESLRAELSGAASFLEPAPALLERLRGYERELGTIRVIPDGDDAKAVLAATPAAARARFLEIAHAAYPEEAPGAAPR